MEIDDLKLELLEDSENHSKNIQDYMKQNYINAE